MVNICYQKRLTEKFKKMLQMSLYRKRKNRNYLVDNYGFKKWSHLESNQAPTDYESVALTE